MKKKEKNSSDYKSKGLVSRLLKFSAYIVLFCLIAYIATWIVADQTIKNHKRDMDDMMSFDRFDGIYQE